MFQMFVAREPLSTLNTAWTFGSIASKNTVSRQPAFSWANSRKRLRLNSLETKKLQSEASAPNQGD
jgi:hypothetical protein